MTAAPLNSWLLAARPKTLLAAVAPVLVGTALAVADRHYHVLSAVIVLLCACCIQIGTNFCNDYCDFQQGADTEDRKGPTRAVQAGLITPRAMLTGTVVVFGLAFVLCTYLVYRAGWPLLVVGTVSILSGIGYTAGKYSLAYLGLGDLFVVVFFGLVATGGTYYVQALQLDTYVLLVGLAPGLLSTGLLAVNNLRDIDEDRAAGKKTLAVRFGPLFARTEYAVCILLPCTIPLFLWLRTGIYPLGMLACATLLPAIPALRIVGTQSGTALNAALGKTAGLLLIYSILFAVGINL